uniref:Exostosin GT47 domain-containing protein n=1 Tax=Alexandrium monilatum TaxID=311494 RepID=A0A7S4VTL0_9DINO
MNLLVLAALLLSVGASCIALWVKIRWRVARLGSYDWGPLPEIGGLVDYDGWVNAFRHRPPFNKMPVTPTITCENDATLLWERYDWQVRPKSPWNTKTGCTNFEFMPWVNITYKGDPRTVFAVPHGLDRLFELAERHCDPSHNNRVVHFGGTEQPLETAFGEMDRDRNATVARLRKYFNRIVFQTKDWQIEGVDLAPMGVCWGYMYGILHNLTPLYRSPRLLAREFFGLVANATETTLSHKTKGVLATRSRQAFWLDEPYTLRRAARQLSRRPPGMYFQVESYTSTRCVLSAYQSRKQLREWAVSSEAVRAGVEFRSLPVPEWWRELPKYRFLLNPMGSGVQTAKTYEALLSLTVPLILHKGYSAFFDLVRMGFPVVLLSNWSDVTPERLERWWQDQSPRLESFRRNCLTLDGYWGLLTGQMSFCE